uniref:Uncharacterized protein n=1 Tax=Alexandrium monilatum TaxID=311494 RepID=A0A7S4VLV7_9DINO
MARLRLGVAAGRCGRLWRQLPLDLLRSSTRRARAPAPAQLREFSDWKPKANSTAGAARPHFGVNGVAAAHVVPAAAAVAASGAAPGSFPGAGAGPDPSRGYDVNEYKGIWNSLSQEQSWPSMQRFSVVGPAGEEFARTVQVRVVETLGWDAAEVKTEPRSRWQSVRLEVRCTSPDDFCALHSSLKSLEGVRFLL